MALHLIIDGYNLIRQSPYLQALDARELEAGREALLACLASYRQARPQHKITVVFDGWEKGDWKESRDRRAGIAIVYSRRGEKADEVIKRLLEKERSRAVVVSSDRELQDHAARVGAPGSAPRSSRCPTSGGLRPASRMPTKKCLPCQGPGRKAPPTGPPNASANGSNA